MSVIFAVDDDGEWLDYYERLLGDHWGLEVFRDGVEVMNRIQDVVPDVLILDVLLTGPTGFSILNEMQSYGDLARVPVIVVSSVEIKEDLTQYGVVCVLDKGKMEPKDLLKAISECDGKP